MKLKVGYELNISPENEALIPVIASQSGWDAQSGIDPKDFINERVTTPQIKVLMERVIEQAVRAYFGLAGKAQADIVMAQYQVKHTITSEFSEESE